MPIWIRGLALVTGFYNFAFVGTIITALAEMAITTFDISDVGILPIPITRFVSGLGGVILIIHSVRLFMGIESSRRFQLRICGTAILCRLSLLIIQVAVFQPPVMLMLKFILFVLFVIALADIPLFLAFRTARVRALFAKAEAARLEREEYRELEKSMKM